ncbi:MAG TPA: hypothetical protein VKY92_09045 [Verrucomicrobiae bacterium]|nr:hypothetical protein [Verrucomicrobiae bacterium]
MSQTAEAEPKEKKGISRPSGASALKITAWLVVGGTFATVAIGFAYYSLFSVFQPYDDEGFILISLRSFFEGKPLYDQVYSMYQPAFYVLYWLLFEGCGIPLCHDNIRLVTLVLWLMAAGLNGLITHRLTGSKLLGLLVCLITVPCLAPFANEPGHPQALAYVLVASLVALLSFAHWLERPYVALGAGALLGLLLLVKLNVGIFTLLPVALLWATRAGKNWRIWLGTTIGFLMMLLPLLLWRAQLLAKGTPATVLWVFEAFGFALAVGHLRIHRITVLMCVLLFAGCAVALLGMNSNSVAALPVFTAGLLSLSICSSVQMCISSGSIEFRPLRWVWGLAGLGVVLAGVIFFVMSRGTTLNGLVDGLVRWPAKVPSSFLIRMRSNWLGLCLGLLGSGTCATYLYLRRDWKDHRWLRGPIAASQLLLGAAILAEFYLRIPGSRTLMPILNDLPHFWMLPFAWLAAVPESGSDDTRFGRLTLVIIGVMQPLIACPIAGTQLVPASMLLPVIGAVCCANGLRHAWASLPAVLCVNRWGPLIGVGALVLLFGLFAKETTTLRQSYESRVPLNLPGARRLRLTAEEVDTYRAVVAELAKPEVTTFLTLPGMNSFYFWSKKEPPNGLNASAWVILLDDRAQEQIWQAARDRGGLKVLRNRNVIRSWVGGRSIHQFPLVRYIEENFHTVATYGGYEVMERQ